MLQWFLEYKHIESLHLNFIYCCADPADVAELFIGDYESSFIEVRWSKPTSSVDSYKLTINPPTLQGSTEAVVSDE